MKGTNPRELRQTARLVLLGLTLVAAVDFVGGWLHERATGAAAVQLAIAEYGAGKLGIAWSPPDTVAPTTRSIALRAARGAGLGFAAAIVMWLVGFATKSLAFRIVFPGFTEVAVGLLVAVLLGARDELLLRGLVLRVTGTGSKGWPVLAACAGAAVARGGSATTRRRTARSSWPARRSRLRASGSSIVERGWQWARMPRSRSAHTRWESVPAARARSRWA